MLSAGSEGPIHGRRMNRIRRVVRLREDEALLRVRGRLGLLEVEAERPTTATAVRLGRLGFLTVAVRLGEVVGRLGLGGVAVARRPVVHQHVGHRGGAARACSSPEDRRVRLQDVVGDVGDEMPRRHGLVRVR